MPSTSPGLRASAAFTQILPGAPTESLQSLATFTYRFKRFIVYISGCQLNILSSPDTLAQAIVFDNDLIAVAAENETGNIAVAGQKDVYILQSVTEGWDKIWWEKALSLKREDAGDEAHRLSWGSEGEVLVGGSRALSLFSTLPSSRTSSPEISPVEGEHVENRRSLWSKSISSPINYADFSPTAGIIASCARYDRLVKIWRRLSFEEGLFDYTYLPHQGPVTYIQWRPLSAHPEERRSSGISGRHEDDAEILYTIASDGVLRIWRSGGMHDLEIMVMHASIDLTLAIPHSPTLTVNGLSPATKPPRYVFTVPSDQFCAAVEAALGATQNGRVNHSIEHLKEISSNDPDMFVALDAHGRMSAWGLQSIGHKRRPETPSAAQAFHITHAEGVNLRPSASSPAAFNVWLKDNKINIIVHALGDNGSVSWWQGAVDAFFSPSTTGSERLVSIGDYCGHTTPVSGLNSTNAELVTWSGQQACLWRLGEEEILSRSAFFGADSKILAALKLPHVDAILTVHANAFILRRTHGNPISEVSSGRVRPGKIFLRASAEGSASGLYIQTDPPAAFIWTVKPSKDRSCEADAALQLRAVSLPSHGVSATPNFLISVPGSAASTFGQIVSLDSDGVVRRSAVVDNNGQEAVIKIMRSFETAIIDPSLFSANQDTAAIASQDRREVVFIDLEAGYVEYRQSTTEQINRLACVEARHPYNLVAVSYATEVEVLIQSQYKDNSSASPTWQPIRKFSITDTGLQINALEWMDTGALLLAAGNAIFFASPSVKCKDLSSKILKTVDVDVDYDDMIGLTQLSQSLNRPLPAWHPSFMFYLVQHGYFGLATYLLQRFAQILKFWTAGEILDPMFGDAGERLLEEDSAFREQLEDETIRDLKQLLGEKELPTISSSEQERLRHVVEAVSYLREHEKGLDQNALRYLLNWKLQILANKFEGPSEDEAVQGPDNSPNVRFVPQMAWREISFVQHSTTQQPLLDILILHYDNKLTWRIARQLGIMAWLSEREALEQVFEQLAQSAYRASQPPDPVNGALFFLALHKKPTLLALWRIATWHKEQKTTMNFLKRDFTQPDARTAAKKNAYALMGKRRFEYAAAFFLLANDPASAISLLAGQCDDVQLAIGVARLNCADGSPVLRNLLETRILPKAQQDGDRWLASWSHSLLLDKTEAAEALIRPIQGVRTWHQDDPSTLLLYRQLRNQSSQYEYAAVLRAVRILRKMGLGLFALELVSRWQFETPSPPRARDNGDIANGVHEDQSESVPVESTSAQPAGPWSLLDDFTTSEAAADKIPDEKSAREAKAAELLKKLKAKKDATTNAPSVKEKKPEPTQFKEPDANSLLDNFGF